MRKNISNITIIQSSSKTSSVYGTIDYKNVLLLRKFIKFYLDVLVGFRQNNNVLLQKQLKMLEW